MASYKHSIRVPESAIDFLGHVNNLHYLSWMIDAAVAHSNVRGWDRQRYQALGAGWVVRSHRIEYLAPAFLDEELLVETWIDSFRKVRCLRKYQIVRLADGKQISTGETDWTFVNFEKHVPMKIPTELLEDFVDGE